MEKLAYFIFTGLLPCLVYTFVSVLLFLKIIRKGEDPARRFQLYVHLLFSLVIGFSYLAFLLIMGSAHTQAYETAFPAIVVHLYIVSLVFTWLNYLKYNRLLKNRMTFRMLLYAGVLLSVVTLLLVVFIRHPKTGDIVLKTGILISVIVLIADCMFCVYQSRKFISCTRIFHMGFMIIYNFLYAFYLHTLFPVFDFIFTIYAYILAHQFSNYMLLKRRKAPDRYGVEKKGESLLEEASSSEIPAVNVEGSLKNRLIHYFEQEKPYLSKNLTMTQVANRLYTNKTYLSKTVNEELDKNFRELVNYFRIREAVKIFSLEKDISIPDLMRRCGFSNNASFTNAFKINTGQTPGEWCRDKRNK